METEVPAGFPERNISWLVLIWDSWRLNRRRTLDSHQGVCGRRILGQHSRAWVENEVQTLRSPVTTDSNSLGLSFLGHKSGNDHSL